MSPATSSTLSSPAAASLAASIIRGSTRAAIARSDRSSSSFRASRLPMNPGYPVSSARAIRDLRRSPSSQPAPAEGPHGPGTGRPGAALQHDRETQVAVAPPPPQLGECIGIPRLRDLAVEAVDLAAQFHLGRSDTGVTQDLVAQAHVRRDPGHVLELERLAASGQRIEVAALDRVLDLCLGDAGEDAQRAYLTPQESTCPPSACRSCRSGTPATDSWSCRTDCAAAAAPPPKAIAGRRAHWRSRRAGASRRDRAHPARREVG